jgi:hypothetical protein
LRGLGNVQWGMVVVFEVGGGRDELFESRSVVVVVVVMWGGGG